MNLKSCHRRSQQAQSAIEYIVLVAAVVATLIIFLNPTGYFRNTVEKTLNSTVDQLNSMVNAISVP